MTPEQLKRCFDLFDELAALGEDERRTAIEELRPDEPEVVAELESLLAADRSEASETHLEPGQGAGVLASGLWSDPSGTLTRVGRYRVVREIGRGGMGVVYEAEQDKPRRTVALKVLSDPGGGRGLARRFEREAELLARLHHRGIAQVFEAGTARAEDHAGHPSEVSFFAMELIRGRRIDAYCDEHALDRRARLALLAAVCDAVQHAHDMGVVHRDLKPENIFVDRNGEPKVLDFGIARITASDVQAVTLQTEVGQILGTAAYMSPEQIRGDSSAIDGRSDVYSLGVVLFRLLSDRMPFDVVGKPLIEAARIIQHEEPTSLSTLDRSLRGDVETIVLAALEKDRDRRYADPAALASDVRRYLADEPLVARPASTIYQFKKFASRNRALVGGVAASIALLIAGVIGTSVALAWALRTKDDLARTNVELDQVNSDLTRANADLERTNVKLEQANVSRARVADFQASILRDLDSTDFGAALLSDLRSAHAIGLEGEELSEAAVERSRVEFDQMLARVNGTDLARSLLRNTIGARAEEGLSTEFDEEPLIEAELRFAMGQMYQNLGLVREAMDQFERARGLFLEHAGPNAPGTVETTFNVGRMHSYAGRWVEAEREILDALGRHDRAFGPENTNRFIWLNRLAKVYHKTRRFDEALASYAEVIAAEHAAVRPEISSLLTAKNNTAVMLMERGRTEEALDIFIEVRDRRVELWGVDHRQSVIESNNVMSALFRLGRFAEAEPYARELLAISTRAEGSDHPATIRARNNLGRILLDTGRAAEAIVLFETVHAQARDHLPTLHEVRLKGAANLIDALIKLERFEEAADHAAELLESRRRVDPPNEFEVSQALEQLGICLIEMSSFERAETALRECIDIRAAISNEHWLTHWARHLHSVALLGLARDAQARPALRDAAAAIEAKRDSVTPTRRAWIFAWIERWTPNAADDEARSLLDKSLLTDDGTPPGPDA